MQGMVMREEYGTQQQRDQWRNSLHNMVLEKVAVLESGNGA